MTHLNNPTTPTGDYFTQRELMQPALKLHLFEEVLTAPNLKRAWTQVRANKGAAGVDGLQIDSFLEWLLLHWKQCERQLRNGHYHPSPVRRVDRYIAPAISAFPSSMTVRLINLMAVNVY